MLLLLFALDRKGKRKKEKEKEKRDDQLRLEAIRYLMLGL